MDYDVEAFAMKMLALELAVIHHYKAMMALSESTLDIDDLLEQQDMVNEMLWYRVLGVHGDE